MSGRRIFSPPGECVSSGDTALIGSSSMSPLGSLTFSFSTRFSLRIAITVTSVAPSASVYAFAVSPGWKPPGSSWSKRSSALTTLTSAAVQS